MPPPLILASASPRRRELLLGAGFRFQVIRPDIEEIAAPGEDPTSLVKRLAQEKAAQVWEVHPAAAVLAADTIVVLEGRILGKPADGAQARAMLEALSGRTHKVYSGVAILAPSGATRSLCVQTEVRFRALALDEIERYVLSGEPLDKAGAYGIQEGAAGFVHSIDGSYTNVVGLPLAETLEAFRELGIVPGAA